MKKETLEEVKLNEKEFYEYMAKQDSWKSTGLIIQEFIQLKLKEQDKNKYSEEEVKEIIKLSCQEGMLIQRTINDKVKIPYTRINDFTIKMFEQFKKK